MVIPSNSTTSFNFLSPGDEIVKPSRDVFFFFFFLQKKISGQWSEIDHIKKEFYTENNIQRVSELINS